MWPPPTTVPVLSADGQFTMPWRRTLQDMSKSALATLTPSQVQAIIVAALAPAIASVATLQAEVDLLTDEAGFLNVLSLLAVAELDGTVV